MNKLENLIYLELPVIFKMDSWLEKNNNKKNLSQVLSNFKILCCKYYNNSSNKLALYEEIFSSNYVKLLLDMLLSESSRVQKWIFNSKDPVDLFPLYSQCFKL